MKKALFFVGGWKGHEPIETSAVVASALEKEGFAVEISEDLEVLTQAARLAAVDLIVMCVTMGELSQSQMTALGEAVEGGVGFAGWHGGMCDAFRTNTQYQFMTGGQFVAHPGNKEMRYRVTVRDPHHEIMQGVQSFDYASEQYYMHVDPAINVLATTVFDGSIRPETEGVVMPVVWTKSWGRGRVFYSALGHDAAEFENAAMLRLLINGLCWAAR